MEVIALFWIWLVLSIFTAVIAGSKGRNPFGWFLIGAFFGIFAMLCVGLMPSLKNERVTQ